MTLTPAQFNWIMEAATLQEAYERLAQLEQEADA